MLYEYLPCNQKSIPEMINVLQQIINDHNQFAQWIPLKRDIHPVTFTKDIHSYSTKIPDDMSVKLDDIIPSQIKEYPQLNRNIKTILWLWEQKSQKKYHKKSFS